MAAYTFAQLKQILYSAADPQYLQPFFDGGYGNGRELFEQLLAVFVRVDEAIDRTLQALYINPWSGQSAPPAAGSSRAVLELTLRRSRRAEVPLTVAAGSVLFEEVARDWNAAGGQDVATGRLYTLMEPVTFLPGQTSPVLAEAVALRVGYGFANPAPGTVTGLPQPGAGFQNDRASVEQTPQAARLIAFPRPDAFVPEHVGQYVQLTAGANAGAVARVVSYETPGPGNGGVVSLANTFVGRAVVTAPAGTFQVGEQVFQEDSSIVPPADPMTASGVVMAVSDAAPWYVVIETSFGSFRPTAGTVGDVRGVLSGASFTVEDVTRSDQLIPESGTASWRILSWADDLGLSVGNQDGAAQTPGSYPMLDALGGERGIPRGPGEPDEAYRERVATVADIVSPNAIRRIGNRIWAPYSGGVCLREVGLQLLPGLYCDADPASASDLAKYAYDLDGEVLLHGVLTGTFFEGERVFQDNGGVLTTARVTTTVAGALPGSPVPSPDPFNLEVALVDGTFVPGSIVYGETSGAEFTPGGVIYKLRVQDRFKLNLDYTEFRAFFLLGVPPASFGEFGIPYDAPHPFNAYDAAPYLTFADGFPLTAAVLDRATWQAVDRARAGGVGFDIYPESVGCV